jgi:hypothetical protein
MSISFEQKHGVPQFLWADYADKAYINYFTEVTVINY